MSLKLKINPIGTIPEVMLAIGLWRLPGIWWAKVLIFLAITISINLEWK